LPSAVDEIVPDDRTGCPLWGAVIPDGEGHRLVSGQPPPGGHDEVIARLHRGPDLAVEANIIDVEYVVEVQAQLLGGFREPDGKGRDAGQELVRWAPAQAEP